MAVLHGIKPKDEVNLYIVCCHMITDGQMKDHLLPAVMMLLTSFYCLAPLAVWACLIHPDAMILHLWIISCCCGSPHMDTLKICTSQKQFRLYCFEWSEWSHLDTVDLCKWTAILIIKVVLCSSQDIHNSLHSFRTPNTVLLIKEQLIPHSDATQMRITFKSGFSQRFICHMISGRLFLSLSHP